MPFDKQNLNINFSQGLDTKTDPKQVQPGKFLSLQNSVFTKAGLLQKRNGNSKLTSLPDTSSTYATTFNGDLTVIGSNLQAYSTSTDSWVNKGPIEPVRLDVFPVIRSNTTQSQADAVVSSNGLVCVVFTDQNPASLGALIFRYAVVDAATGQNIIAPTQITGASTTNGFPKVYTLGNYFIIVFTSAANHLQFIAININDTSIVTAAADITTSYTPSTTTSFDGVVFNNYLYMAWNGAAASGVKMATVSSSLAVSASIIVHAGYTASLMSACVDMANSVIRLAYTSGTTSIYSLAVDPNLVPVDGPNQFLVATTILNVTCVSENGLQTVFYENDNNYGYGPTVPTHFIKQYTRTIAGVQTASAVVIRSVGLASRAFIVDGIIYVLTAYQSPFQNTYFLVNASGNVIVKLAYENGGGYLVNGLPGVTVIGTQAQFPYLFKDLIQALTTNGNSQQTTTGGIYSQLGINMGTINFVAPVVSSEIGANLNVSGGFLWGYDGSVATEQNFFLWPDNVVVSTSGAGGLITAQQYYYIFTYEWTDNQGNAFKSAPSVPVTVTTVGATSTNTLNVPTLRLTYKTANPVKIVGYRWSVANPNYYQFTSIVLPTLNDPTVDSVTITDTLADSSIVGNNLVYTTGGVVEDINGPATNITTLFDDRLWLVDAEDPNLLWYSKQVIEATPVEMSDLFTMYVAPTTGAQGSTGFMTALSPMDDKLCIFKRNSILYVNGQGPDNTGANSQYSQPIFVTSTVGCANPASIVFIPNGLMFQSDKGIWLLGRDLSTQYIGAPVEEFNGALVLSALNIPGTNQVRFTLDSGVTLMYDYYFNQWGSFINVPAISSTLFQGLQTYINQYGEVYQENTESYLDGSKPVLLQFTTGWINLAGLQGYQRAYFFYLLGQYKTPHKLLCTVAYDYNPSPVQSQIISPTNFSPAYGAPESNGQSTVYGEDTPYGGPGDKEQWRVFLTRQRCQAFQITVQEIYDPSLGIPAGEGLTLSGLNLVLSIKRGWKSISSAHSVGGSS